MMKTMMKRKVLRVAKFVFWTTSAVIMIIFLEQELEIKARLMI